LAGLSDVQILRPQNVEATSSHYCLSFVLGGLLARRRNEIVKAVNAEGIGTSVYYPQPVPRFSYYRSKYGYSESAYPNAAAISDGTIALPVGPHLNDDDMIYIADTVRHVVRNVNK